MNNIVIVTVLVICSAIKVDATITCWKCRSNDDKESLCGDTFAYDDSNKFGQSLTEYCEYGCLKLKDGYATAKDAGFHDEWKVIRGCYEPKNATEAANTRASCGGSFDNTFQVKGIEVKTKGANACVCKTDYCNSATRPTGVAACLMMTILYMIPGI